MSPDITLALSLVSLKGTSFSKKFEYSSLLCLWWLIVISANYPFKKLAIEGNSGFIVVA